MSIRLIHIAPTNLISKIDNWYNKGLNMVLTHLVLTDRDYAKEMSLLKGEKYLDNSFFELGYCMSPEEILEAAKIVGATVLICPDGTKDGLKKFKEAGYKVMCIPKGPNQFEAFMFDPEIDLVGVSEEHLDYRHSPGARYELFRDHLTDAMPKKKIHLLGATDSCWELGMLKPFKEYIYSWDSSAAIWQGHLGNLLMTQKRKDCTAVDFSKAVDFNLIMKHNLDFLEGLVNG